MFQISVCPYGFNVALVLSSNAVCLIGEVSWAHRMNKSTAVLRPCHSVRSWWWFYWFGLLRFSFAQRKPLHCLKEKKTTSLSTPMIIEAKMKSIPFSPDKRANLCVCVLGTWNPPWQHPCWRAFRHQNSCIFRSSFRGDACISIMTRVLKWTKTTF